MRWTEEELRAYQDKNRPEPKQTGPTEDDEQILLMVWAEYSLAKLPELKLLFHIPNGGSRHPAEAGKLRAMGVKAGVPDLFLPVPRGIYHGLFIEMKREHGGHATPEQEAWLEDLAAMGYCCRVCHGFTRASDIITRYLSLNGTDDLEGSDPMS